VTFLVPWIDEPLSANDLPAIDDHTLASRVGPVRQIEKQYARTICDDDFGTGTLVLRQTVHCRLVGCSYMLSEQPPDTTMK